MKYVDFQAERGKFIQRRECAPDHCRIHPEDAQQLVDTAPGSDVRITGAFAMVAGVPVIMDATVEKGQALFETRQRMSYEAPPAHQKRRKPLGT
jgi:hypothetical protein